MTTGINELTSTEQGVTPAVLESLASDVQAVREQLISSGVPLGRKPRHDFVGVATCGK